MDQHAPNPVPRTSTMAIISLVTGVMCIPVVSIILGHLARSEINRSNGSIGGAGIALAGLILGYLQVVSGVLLVVIPMLVAGGMFFWLNLEDSGSKRIEGEPSIAMSEEPLVMPKEEERNLLVKGQLYYLFASEIELYPTNPENEPWDGGGNGPDIKYRILWQGNRVFESVEKDDSLIADWNGLSFGLEWTDLIGKTLSLDEAIKAARVRYEKGGSLEIVVVDKDLVDDEDAGRVKIELDDLIVGKNEIKLAKTSINGVRRINLVVLPHGLSVKDFVEFASRF